MTWQDKVNIEVSISRIIKLSFIIKHCSNLIFNRINFIIDFEKKCHFYRFKSVIDFNASIDFIIKIFMRKFSDFFSSFSSPKSHETLTICLSTRDIGGCKFWINNSPTFLIKSNSDDFFRPKDTKNNFSRFLNFSCAICVTTRWFGY